MLPLYVPGGANAIQAVLIVRPTVAAVPAVMLAEDPLVTVIGLAQFAVGQFVGATEVAEVTTFVPPATFTVSVAVAGIARVFPTDAVSAMPLAPVTAVPPTGVYEAVTVYEVVLL
jgi:hypothetical protein